VKIVWAFVNMRLSV